MSESTQTQQVVNGVNVGQMFETIDAIKETPSIAKFNFRATNEWLKCGAHNQTTVNEFYGACQTHTRERPFVFDKDEPPLLLGKDKGANPVEYVLAALAGCMTTAIIYHAAAKGIHLTKIESKFEGDLDLQGFLGMSDEVRNGYEQLRVTFDLEGGATEEQLDELVQIARERSPVFDIVSNGVPIQVQRAK